MPSGEATLRRTAALRGRHRRSARSLRFRTEGGHRCIGRSLFFYFYFRYHNLHKEVTRLVNAEFT